MATKKPTKKKTTTKKTEEKKESVLVALQKVLKPSMIRFVYLYLGSEDGKCFNNATLAYIRAYNIETSVVKDKDGKYSKQYLSSKSSGYDLLTKPDIQAFKNAVLLESGFNPDTIKRRFAELAYQNKNLPIAHASTRDIAKIAGVMKEDSKSVDIPQLTELTDHIKKILTP
jgi:hypothetical protein